MPSYNPIIKNGASGAILYISLAPRTATGAWQANPTLAAGDVKISLDGGALANLTTLPVVTPAGSKLVKVTLSQAETNGDNLTILFSDAAGAEWNDLTVNLQTVAANFDSLSARLPAALTGDGNIKADALMVNGETPASLADVNAEMVDVISVDTYAEPASGAPAATDSLAAKVGYLFKSWRNKKEQTSTEFRLFADDGTTVDHLATVGEASGTVTRGVVDAP